MVRRINKPCHTAKKGKKSAMVQVGISSALTIKLPGLSKVLYVPEPVVLRGLVDEVNVGSGALQRWGVDLRYRPDGTTLADAFGTDQIPLIAKIATSDTVNVEPPMADLSVPRGRPAVNHINGLGNIKSRRSQPPTRAKQVSLKVKGTQVLRQNALNFVRCMGVGQ